MSEEAIVTERLVLRYRGKAALDGVDLRVPRGSIFAFLGDNGAGKTTTMKVLTGLAQADSGRAAILGLDVFDLPPTGDLVFLSFFNSDPLNFLVTHHERDAGCVTLRVR